MSTVTEVAMFPLRRLAVGVLIIWCVAVRTADASPITYLYTGAAFAPDLQDFIPIGSPATILLTVDPAANLVGDFGPPNFYPPNVGLYRFSAVLDLTGREYTLGGYLEINEDVGRRVPHPGSVDLVEATGVQGPPLVTDHPPLYGPATACGFTVCLIDNFGGGSDPTSPALPFFPLVSFPISFEVPVTDPNQFPFDRVTISGSNPQVVAEPSSLLLVGTGLVAVARRRLARSKNSKVVVRHTC
jgi:hypothetical protein